MRQWIEYAQAVTELDALEARLNEMVEAGVADFRIAAQLYVVEATQDEVDTLADDLAEFYGFGDGQAPAVHEQRRPASEIVEGEWLR